MRKSNDSTSDLRGVFTATTTGVTPERGPLGDGAIEKSERDVASKTVENTRRTTKSAASDALEGAMRTAVKTRKRKPFVAVVDVQKGVSYRSGRDREGREQRWSCDAGE